MRYHIRKGTIITRYQSGKRSRGEWFITTKDVVYGPQDVLNVVMSKGEPTKYSFTLPKDTKDRWQYITADAQDVEVITDKKLEFIRNENWGQ